MSVFGGYYKKYGWLLILPFFFLLYATSFNRFEILEKRHSVLAEADSAAFNILVMNFDLTKKYGNEYKLGDRQLGDVAQKHKIHHTLYFLAAGALGRGLTPLNEAIGISPKQTLYTINALLSCINIGLLYLLLKTLSPSGRNPVPLVILYGFSLSTWVYSSVTESWILSVTLLLVFLLAFLKTRNGLVALSAFVGLAMTNNIWLCTMFAFILMRQAAECPRLTDFLKKTLAGIAIAVLTWALAMSFFSIFDESISPVNYVKYTLWFKQHIAPQIVLFQSYVWKSSITNVLVNSVLSNQSDPYIPQEALLLTIRQSIFGIVATCFYLVVLLITFWRFADCLRVKFQGSVNKMKIFEAPTLQIAVFAGLWVVMPVILDTSGAFLHSTLVTPLMVVIIYRHYRVEDRGFAWLLYGTVFLVIANNINEILKFQDALAKLH